MKTVNQPALLPSREARNRSKKHSQLPKALGQSAYLSHRSRSKPTSPPAETVINLKNMLFGQERAIQSSQVSRDQRTGGLISHLKKQQVQMERVPASSKVRQVVLTPNLQV